MALGATAAATVLAGCAAENADLTSDPDADGDQGSTDQPTEEAGDFRLLISDMPADIGDFDRLDVTFDHARVFEGGGDGDDEGEDTADDSGDGVNNESSEDSEDFESDENNESSDDTEEISLDSDDDDPDNESSNGTNETALDAGEDDVADAEDSDDDGADGDGQRGFYTVDLDGATVDLTQVVGDRAIAVFEGELSEGTYQKIELHVEGTEGIVEDEEVVVHVPSEKLQITHPFEIRSGEAVDFVFDINVVKRGQQDSYNLTPVISESGIAGEDVEVEEVELDDDEDDEEADDAEATENEGDEEEQEEEEEDSVDAESDNDLPDEAEENGPPEDDS